MPEPELNGLLTGAVTAVLETMFFTEPLGPGEADEAPALAAHLSFRGSPSGELAVSLTTAAARPLAAGFLGEDEVNISDSQAGEVVCEMANMLCGSVVSKLESEMSFDLSSPELMAAGEAWPEPRDDGSWARQSFALENGTLTVVLRLQGPSEA